MKAESQKQISPNPPKGWFFFRGQFNLFCCRQVPRHPMPQFPLVQLPK